MEYKKNKQAKIVFMKINKIIISAITSYMNEKNITVKQFAVELGLSHTTVGRWLNGKSTKIKCENWEKLTELIEINETETVNNKISEISELIAEYYVSIPRNDKERFIKFIINSTNNTELRQKFINLLRL